MTRTGIHIYQKYLHCPKKTMSNLTLTNITQGVKLH